MIKPYLTTLLILCGFYGFSQVDFVKVNGYNDIRVIFNNPTKLQASALSIPPSPSPVFFPDTFPFYLETTIYNSNGFTVDSIYIKGDFTYSHPSFFSDTVSILPGDTMILQSKFLEATDFSSFNFENSIKLELYDKNGIISTDSLPFNLHRIKSGMISLNYGTTDNYISTNDIGHDGSAIAQLVPVYALTAIEKIKIEFGPNTVYGGDIQFEIYDSGSFDLQNGFTSTPILSHSFTLSPNSHTFTIPNSQWLFNSSKTSPEYYFFVVWFFSNAGSHEIEIANSQRNPQNRGNIYYYDVNETKWKDSRDTGAWFSNPRIDFFTEIGHVDYFPQSLKEYEHPDLILYPNPTSSGLKIKLPSDWPQSEMQIEISGLSGKIISTHNYFTDQELDLGKLPRGIYLIKGKVGDKEFIRRINIE